MKFLASILVGLTAMSFTLEASAMIKPHHKDAGLTCASCHVTEGVKVMPEEEVCLTCHISRDAVAKQTKALDPNPHFGHDESVVCTDCHKEHDESTATCNDCHGFNFKTP